VSDPRPFPPQFSFGNWLKAQVALLPLLMVTGAVAFKVANAHFDDRYDDRYVAKANGQEVQAKVDAVASDVQDIKVKQAVNAEQTKTIGSKVDEINDKLDRLIERR
jgi:hypothetical protein